MREASALMKIGKWLTSTVTKRKGRIRRRSRRWFSETAAAVSVLAAAVLLSSLMVCGFAYILSHPFFTVRDTVVRGLNRLTETEIREMACPDSSWTLFTADLEALRDRVGRHPWIKEVHVGREFPDRIVIEVLEHEPLALIKGKDGIHIVDRDNKIFKTWDPKETIDCPVITGVVQKDGLNKEALQRACELVRSLEENDAFPRCDDVSEIHYDEAAGITIYTDNRLYLRLGIGDYSEKFMRLQRVLRELQWQARAGTCLTIDLVDVARAVVIQRDLPVAGSATDKLST